MSKGMSNVDYSFGNADGNGKDAAERDDKREDYRLSGRASVVLELESGVPEDHGHPATDSLTMTCRIRDLSAKGLCLLAPEPLTVGALLPARVILGQNQDDFALTVDVVWCRADDGGSWLVGVEIQDSDGTSYVDWVEAVARVMTED